jgi:protein-arginine kinase activator protein McsA
MLVLPNSAIFIWEKFLQENKILVYKYAIRQIKKGLEQNKKKIDLFRCEDNSLYAWIPQKEIPRFLNEALRQFVKEEEYEYAGKVKQILNLYHVTKLINESTVEE